MHLPARTEVAVDLEPDALQPRMGGKRDEAEVRIAELLSAGWTEVGLVMDGVRGFVASGGRDCAQCDPPDLDDYDDWPDEEG